MKFLRLLVGNLCGWQLGRLAKVVEHMDKACGDLKQGFFEIFDAAEANASARAAEADQRLAQLQEAQASDARKIEALVEAAAQAKGELAEHKRSQAAQLGAVKQAVQKMTRAVASTVGAAAPPSAPLRFGVAITTWSALLV